MSTPMSAECIEALRDEQVGLRRLGFPFTEPAKHYGTMLDEIERLRGLVAEAHQRVPWMNYNHRLTTVECTCGWRRDHVSTAEADVIFAAHVDELIPGWKP